MANVQHSSLTDPYLHEPKGISSAAADEAYISDGAGTGAWKTPYFFGVEDYADSATTGTPIALSSGSKVKLTNDGLGANTNKTYKVPGEADIWVPASNHFDFSATSLKLGDTVDFRFDVTVNASSTNDGFDFILTPGFGASPYDLEVGYAEWKTATAHNFVFFTSVYMGDTNTLNNPMEVYIKADSASDTVVVNGWYVRPMYRNGLWV